MRCKRCGRLSKSELCSQCKITKIEYDALEYDFEEWGREADEVSSYPGAKKRGAKAIQKKWRRKK